MQAGEVRWNGVAVSDLNEFLRPPRAAYTSQVPRLFSETLRENLLLGLPEVDVDLDKDLRPIPGFLDFQHWKRNLEKAGFKNIEAIFNTDGSYPDELKAKIGVLAAVIKAEK